MTLDEYKLHHSEIIMLFQYIEHDLKLIYSYMLKGKNVDKNYKLIKNDTLGQMVVNLKNLDFQDDDHLLEEDDYNILGKMAGKRNFWVHQCYTDFAYEENDLDAQTKFSKQCRILLSDLRLVQNAHDILEPLRVEFCANNDR